MIEINLLPEEQKKKTVKMARDAQMMQTLYVIPLIFGVILLVHLVLAAVFLIRSSQLAMLNARWKMLEPQRKQLENARKEYDALFQDNRIIQQSGIQHINWANGLSRLSLHLPPGVWFNDLAFSSSELVLKCSVVSLKKEEMLLINKFIDGLKGDPLFFSDYSAVEIGSVQMKKIGGYDVVDFIITAKVRGRR